MDIVRASEATQNQIRQMEVVHVVKRTGQNMPKDMNSQIRVRN